VSTALPSAPAERLLHRPYGREGWHRQVPQVQPGRGQVAGGGPQQWLRVQPYWNNAGNFPIYNHRQVYNAMFLDGLKPARRQGTQQLMADYSVARRFWTVRNTSRHAHAHHRPFGSPVLGRHVQPNKAAYAGRLAHRQQRQDGDPRSTSSLTSCVEFDLPSSGAGAGARQVRHRPGYVIPRYRRPRPTASGGPP
jgi:hypothetical protein